uniref:Bloodthirsty-related gene family, member 2 n=1 Tax=Poecilia formosa TaxID=48698 RepID=A0A087YK03_POEFO
RSEMSSGSSLWSKDQFLCSICQDVFTDPVSTPCGHNFCKTCITRLWDANVPYKCPLCNEHFASRPQLRVNTLLKEVVDQFRGEAQQECLKVSKQIIKTSHMGRHDRLYEIQDKQEATEKRAEDFIRDLEQEISELKKRSSEVKQLSQDEDPLHLLQSFSSLKDAPPTKTWTEVRVHPPAYEGTVVRAVAQIEQKIREMMKELMKAEMKRFQQFAVDVTLDPDSAHPKLILSEDGKQVKYGDVRKNLPDNPERFSSCVNVLGQQSFSSGRFYFEVQVKGKTDWTLGVARESISRKGKITLSPQNGFWTVWLRNGNEYKALVGPPTRLHLHPAPQKVGVFVDYEEGLVSFYDVDAAALIYSFTGCSFKEKLYPYFSPSLNAGGKNSAPLIICPVNQAD